MVKKIICSIIIPAFLLQVFGCYSVNEVNKNDAAWHNNNIQSVILINGSKIRFDSNGGRYFFEQGTIEGIDDLGIYNKVLLSNVRALYKDKFKPVPLKLNNEGNIGIKFVLLNNRSLLEFDKDSYILDTIKNIITGKLINGSNAEVDINNIKEVYNQAPDTISIYDRSSSISCFLNIDNCLINLDKNTEEYQPAKAEIIGKSRIGEPININVKDVKSIIIDDSKMPGWVIEVGISVIFLGIIIAGIASRFRLPIGR